MIPGDRNYFAKRDANVWWCDTGPNVQSGEISWAWAGAPEFAQFVLNSKRGVELWRSTGFDVTKAQKLHPGDVLGQASPGSSTYAELGHLCIVLEVFSDPKRSLIGQHSGHRGSPVSFDALKSDTTHVWYAWRMHRNYPDLPQPQSRGTVIPIKGDYIPYVHR
jgi:hypothetical protein